MIRQEETGGEEFSSVIENERLQSRRRLGVHPVDEGIFDAFRQMTHIETDKGKTALALGIRDSNLDLDVKIKKKRDHEQITIHFPDGAG